MNTTTTPNYYGDMISASLLKAFGGKNAEAICKAAQKTTITEDISKAAEATVDAVVGATKATGRAIKHAAVATYVFGKFVVTHPVQAATISWNAIKSSFKRAGLAIAEVYGKIKAAILKLFGKQEDPVLEATLNEQGGTIEKVIIAELFEKQYDAIDTTADYSTSWENGTDYFDHAVTDVSLNSILSAGEMAKSIDPHGRKIIMMQTPLGLVVVFERHSQAATNGTASRLAINTTREVREYLRLQELDPNEPTLAWFRVIFGSPLKPNLGEKLAADQQQA